MNGRMSTYKQEGFVGAEQVWAKRASQHDAEAFAWLYKRSVNKIYKYIYYRVPSAAQAEDLTAQVFLKAWEAIHHYRCTDRPFVAWLFRIAHNLVVDHYRSNRASISIEDLQLADETVEDTEEIVEQHITQDHLRRAVQQLTADQQQVIVLKALMGYSTEELAQIMDRDTGAIRALQHRGLVALHRILEKNYAMADRIPA